jgi:hypothetical protein
MQRFELLTPQTSAKLSTDAVQAVPLSFSGRCGGPDDVPFCLTLLRIFVALGVHHADTFPLDASISQSALEDALLSNIQHGRMSTLSQLRSRYL